MTGAIDCHSHLYPREYLDAVARLVDEPGEVGAVARLTTNHHLIGKDAIHSGAFDERIALMDAGGVETHVLSWPGPNVWHPDPSVRAMLVRTFNDACVAVTEQYPGRFKLLANMPLPFVDETIAESERMLDHPDVVGIGMCTHVAGVPIDDDRFAPAFEHWNTRQAPVFFHPEGFCVPGALSEYGMDYAVGVTFDDTIVAVRLIFSGMVTRYPNISWIVPHLGGTFPFLLGRLNFLWELNPSLHSMIERPPGEFLDTIFFDTVTPQAASIKLTANVIGTERLVLGSDFPWASRHDLDTGRRLMVEAGLDEAQVQAVLRDNIASKFGLGHGN